MAFLLALACIAGCRPANRITTASGLASALKGQGLEFESTEGLRDHKMKYARIEEGLVLVGRDLRVELLRIEDDRTRRLFRSAVVTVTGLRGSGAGAAPGFLEHGAFVAVIREEPAPNTVRDVWEKVFPSGHR